MNYTRILMLCAVLLMCVAGWHTDTHAQARQSSTGPRDGEHCLLCEKALGEHDHALEHRGRRVTVCSPCKAAFEDDPDAGFLALQARGALFQEGYSPTRAMRGPWFWSGVYVLAGLLCGALAAYVAVNRAQPALPWFFAGFVGNVLTLIGLLFLMPQGETADLPAGVPKGLCKVPTTRAAVACSSCGRDNHPSAARCSSCDTPLNPRVASEVRRVQGGV